MLKRFMPLLFVIVVVLATALLYLVLRDQADAPPAEQRSPASMRPAVGIGPDGVAEFRVTSEEEYQRALAALGTSNEQIEAWARSRGFPPATYTSSPGIPLARNYRREPLDHLRELALAGDAWAMQFLADRTYLEHPEEAVDWYRQAVLHGSAYAAIRLGQFYADLERRTRTGQDDRPEVQQLVKREDPLEHSSLGWLMVAEYEAGLPPGAISATVTSFHSPDEDIEQACRRAAAFLAEIRTERQPRGLALPGYKPPLAVELPPEETAGYCSPELFPRTDYSDCETVRFVGEVGSVLAHRCR